MRTTTPPARATSTRAASSPSPSRRTIIFITVLRNVERNPLRAGLVERVEDWRWSSLAHRQGDAADRLKPLLHSWPTPEPADWLERVNQPETEAELEAVRQCVARGQPYGSAAWQEGTAKALKLEYTFRKPGRPRKHPEERV